LINEILAALRRLLLQNFADHAAGIWGAYCRPIPGMTGTMAFDLGAAFTFYMAPVPSILLLVALYKGVQPTVGLVSRF